MKEKLTGELSEELTGELTEELTVKLREVLSEDLSLGFPAELTGEPEASMTARVTGGLAARIKAFLTMILAVMMLCLGGAKLNGQTYPYREYTPDDGLPQTQSTYIMQDSRGYLWIPTRNGLARYDGHSFISYLRKDGLPSNMLQKVIECRNGVIWAITLNGMARFDGKSFTPFPVPDSIGIKQILGGCEGASEESFFLSASIDYDNYTVLLFSDGKYRNLGLDYPPLASQKFIPAVANRLDTILYLFDRYENVWSYDKKKLSLIQKGPVKSLEIIDGRLTKETQEMKRALDYGDIFWDGTQLSFNYTDNEGTLWLGTETSIYRLLSEAFIDYDAMSGLPEGTWALVADPRGGIWTGTVDGSLKYFDGTGFIGARGYRSLFSETLAFYRGSTLLSNGEVWFSTNLGVLVWDGKRFSRPAIAPYDFQVCIIYEDPVDKTVFVGTDKGLFHLKGDEVINYEQMSWPGYGIVEGVARDHSGNYWLAGHYGVVFFDGKEFVPFRSAPAPAEMVWGILCDPKGNIWSAGSDGLFLCSPDEPEFIPALPADINMPANVIRQLDENRLLVGRMTDICIIDLDKYYKGEPDYYFIVDRNRGFTGSDCQDNGIVKDKLGRWWILANEKLIRFMPGKLEKNQFPPRNHITRVEVPGDNSEWESLLEASLFYNEDETVKLKGRRNRIRISYTAISTRNPENVRYQYRMKGLDENWSQPTDERRVIFPNLRPGEYNFEMQAISADGVISTSPATLTINVVPTFFQSAFTLSAIALMALLLVVFLTLQIRKNVLTRRIATARSQAESYRLQLNSVVRQFDPHFTFNAVTSIGSLIMKGEKERAYHYFIKLSNLLRSVISDSGKLLKSLEQELEFVNRYCNLQQLRFRNRFEYRIEVDPAVNLATPVPKMIIQSFVENALKHGLENKTGQGIIEVNISSPGKGIEVVVRDNGIGRAAAARIGTDGLRTGLKNINGIVETINKAYRQKITVSITDLFDNGQAAGTEVRIFLPHNFALTFPGDLITIE